MEAHELNTFDDIPTFSEYLAAEERNKQASRRHWFVIMAMFFYVVIRVAAFAFATVIALQGNLWIGAGLFTLSLFMRFQFNTEPPVPAQAGGGKVEG